MSIDENNNELHLVMFPFLAFGHISPFVQLANKLSAYSGVRISFLAASANVRRIETMLNCTATTQIIPLTLPHVDGLPEGNHLFLGFYGDQHRVGDRLVQPQYTTNNRRSHQTSTRVAGTISLRTFEAPDFLYIFKSFHGTPSVIDRLMKCFDGCDAILIKSCREIEGPYLDYFAKQIKKPLLLIGPLVPEPHSGELDQTWTDWLSHFPARSVIYCSFGSETFLTDDQITELALGLELTGLPFFLVLNFPANLDSSAEVKRTLPPGFMERVKGKGVVHSGWVQQRHILAHESVGCHVCHAGFSSVIEALVNDCQLVMLPLKGDQLMNSKLVALDWRVGVEVKRREEDGYFGKEDVLEAVKSVMMETKKEPAKSIRENHKKWKRFLQNNEIQNKYITDLVKDLKALAQELI
ncbi:hypothetical protein L1887_21591 [Cichorium endivia]|nr:hypothetical protein L1887_21591 [Cichorium endivia]